MKPMSDKSMKMRKGEASSPFPTEAHAKMLPKAGEIKNMKYPDTEEAIHSCQQHEIAASNRGKAKAEYRH